MNIIELAISDPKNPENVILAKEFLIRQKDDQFVDRLNGALKYANTYQMNDNKIELMFMRK